MAINRSFSRAPGYESQPSLRDYAKPFANPILHPKDSFWMIGDKPFKEVKDTLKTTVNVVAIGLLLFRKPISSVPAIGGVGFIDSAEKFFSAAFRLPPMPSFYKKRTDWKNQQNSQFKAELPLKEPKSRTFDNFLDHARFGAYFLTNPMEIYSFTRKWICPSLGVAVNHQFDNLIALSASIGSNTLPILKPVTGTLRVFKKVGLDNTKNMFMIGIFATENYFLMKEMEKKPALSKDAKIKNNLEWAKRLTKIGVMSASFGCLFIASSWSISLTMIILGTVSMYTGIVGTIEKKRQEKENQAKKRASCEKHTI